MKTSTKVKSKRFESGDSNLAVNTSRADDVGL